MYRVQKCLWRYVIAALVAFFLILILSFSASAAQPGSVTSTHVRVRSQPSTDSEILAQLEPDDTLEILDFEDDWCRVCCTDDSGEGLTGYIRSDLVTPVAERNQAGISLSASVEADTALYEEPDPDSGVCVVVSPEDTLILMNRSAGNGWSLVLCTIDGQTYTGYLPENALVLNPITSGVTSSNKMTFFSCADGSGDAGLLPTNTELEILDFTDDGWCLVRADGVTGYVRQAMITLTEEDTGAGSTQPEYVSSGQVLPLMSGTGEDYAVLSEIPADTVLSVDGKLGNWYTVNFDGLCGYVCCDAVSPTTAGGKTGQAVADYACQFLGNPYRWGGTSLTNGADCSGFVMSVYAHFGVSLPHSSRAMRNCGTAVSLSEIQPGDIVCYSGHVGIYAGNGQIINALNSRTGIVYTSVTYQNIITIRRIFN